MAHLRLFTNHGKIPAILYGPGDVAHTHSVNEFVPLDEMITCTKVLALTIYRTWEDRCQVRLPVDGRKNTVRAGETRRRVNSYEGLIS